MRWRDGDFLRIVAIIAAIVLTMILMTSIILSKVGVLCDTQVATMLQPSSPSIILWSP